MDLQLAAIVPNLPMLGIEQLADPDAGFPD